MLTLHQFVPNPKRPDPSAFCSKVELFLKIHNLPYEGKAGNPLRAPKGKLPTLRDGEALIADSENIIQYLSEKFHIDPEAGLSAEQKAVSFMIRKTLEEHYYFIMLYTRWIDAKGFAVIPNVLFAHLPIPLKAVVPNIVRKQVQWSLRAQGIGRHESDEVGRRGREVLTHLAQFIGKSTFAFGETPTLADCVIFPYLWGAFHYPSDSELRRTVPDYPAFKVYVDRILDRYYN